MRNFYQTILAILLGFTGFSQEQMAIWTFPSVANASTTSQYADAEQLSGTPYIKQYYQTIDDNGKGGTTYTDLLSVNQVASSAIAWDDIKGSGADAELWFYLNTTGWYDLSMRFDYKSESAEGFDILYSTDGGLSWMTIAVQTPLTTGYNWEIKNLDWSNYIGLNDQSNLILKFVAFDETGNNKLVFDNIELAGTQYVEIPGLPYIYADVTNNSRFVKVAHSVVGSLSGVVNDPTDPGATKGIDFILRDSDTPLTSLVFSLNSSNASVVPAAGLTYTTINDSVRRVFIDPVGAGYSDITLDVSDGTTTQTYTLHYAASGSAYDPAMTNFHTGGTDASSAISVGDNYIVVSDDEVNALLLYHKDSSGAVLNSFDMGTPMGLTLEGDFEGSFRKGNKAYWIGSQGNSKSGNIRPDRHKFFSTTITGSGATTVLDYEGSYTLHDDLISWGDGNGYDFTSSAADGEIPKQIDGFNVEGLALGPDGTSMYIGFRAPMVPLAGPDARTKALICPVTDFETWYNNGSPVGAPTFGAPIELDLGGRTIRSIDRNDDGEYLIVAGDYAEGNVSFALYEWSGDANDAPLLLTADLTGMNPEAIVDFPSPLIDGTVIELANDDGTADWYQDLTESKSLPDANFKKFRTQTVTTHGASPVPCNATASTTTIAACESYLWTDGTTYTASGTYTQVLTNAGGCDSTATLDLTINAPSASTTTIAACESYLWTDGTTYTASGTYTQVLTNALGCDSTATLDLTINTPSASTTTIAACESYLWTDGTTYTASGTYTQVLTNALGCDSTATLDLTINTPSASTTTIAACESYLWTDGTTYTASGTYTQVLTNALGCDSTATLDLTINTPSASTTTIAACESYLWTDGTTYTASGTYTQVLTNALGCDSTATLDLTINSPSSSLTNWEACDVFTWTDGNSYYTSGIYTQLLTNYKGCDSTATLDLTIHESSTSSFDVNALDSYVWNGTTYTQPGAYTDIFQDVHGCDSVVTLNLELDFTGLTALDLETIVIAPNPTSGTLVFSNAGAAVQLDGITVYDNNGRLIQILDPSLDQHDVSALETGVYYVVFENDGIFSRQKLVKL